MTIALLALPGLALGGAALGIGAGLAWVEILKREPVRRHDH